MAAALARANQAYVDGLFDEAFSSYSASIDAEPSANAFAGRAAVSLKRNKPTAALQDANAALSLESDCEPALWRKGRASFDVDEFETALSAFTAGLAAAPAAVAVERKYSMWLRKCEAEIEEEEEEEEEAAVEAPPTPVVAPPLAPVAPSSVKYQYYQTPTHVTITVLAKGITAETAEIVIEDKSLVVRVVIGGFEMTVINGELYDPVVKDKASVKFLSTKVEIKLPKKEAFNWNELLIGACIGDDPAKRAHPPPRTTSAGATATATPYSSKRDWRRLEKDCEAELAAEAPEGEEALNKLFQDIYGKATPETRRAMNKSFQTSGGTVLSTNWGEVSGVC